MKFNLSLSECTSGGCGAKIGADALKYLLTEINVYKDKNLLVGYDTSDDAAVYQISDSLCTVSTMDFFPPMVEDPYTFGCIAAANALSDIYAMGAKPIMALNMVCYPQKAEIDALKQIIAGGVSKLYEAETSLAGGHSIYDNEIKYGLSVTGIVEKDKILKNNTPLPEDKLILTKPLGTGIVLAANRLNEASGESIQEALSSMQHLNKYAALAIKNYNVSSCTDITGFGFLTHLLEMLGSNYSAEINVSSIPLISDVLDYASEFFITAAGQRNRNNTTGKSNIETLDFALQEVLLDPQTSGGLLLSVPSYDAEEILGLIKKSDPKASIIGSIKDKNDVSVIFK